MIAVRFERRGDVYAARFAYDPALVAVVKTVPQFARSWDPARREWLVDLAYVKQLAADVSRMGYLVTGLEPDNQDDAAWARMLFRRVGPSRAEPVFRSLTRVLHPDNAKTGDTDIQRELNAARAELTSERNSSAA